MLEAQKPQYFNNSEQSQHCNERLMSISGEKEQKTQRTLIRRGVETASWSLVNSGLRVRTATGRRPRPVRSHHSSLPRMDQGITNMSPEEFSPKCPQLTLSILPVLLFPPGWSVSEAPRPLGFASDGGSSSNTHPSAQRSSLRALRLGLGVPSLATRGQQAMLSTQH